MVAVHAGAHSEHVQVIRCNFKPGSVKRSINVLEIVRLLIVGFVFLS
jgi:hypothetical protein